LTRPAHIVAGIVTALLLLFGAYMGSYYALLEVYWLDDDTYETWPGYRIDNDGVAMFFVPAHQLDRLMRPSIWNQYPTGSVTTNGRYRSPMAR
jgi:hypothetical protein